LIALLALVSGFIAAPLISPAWAQFPPYPVRPKNEAVLQRLAASGTQPIGAGPVEAAAHIRAEMARWDRVRKAAGVQPN
jgi:hypothetical protein